MFFVAIAIAILAPIADTEVVEAWTVRLRWVARRRPSGDARGLG
jgi:hypothetical protein